MDKKEPLRKKGFRESIRRAEATAQAKRKRIAEEKDAERVREFQREQARRQGEKFDDD